MAFNAATLAAIVAACWAHPSGVSYLAKIDQIEALSISCGNPCCRKAGGGKQARHARKILVERIESLDDLVEQLAEVTKNEPKSKPLLRKAKKSRPVSTESTYNNAQAWIDYYQAVILAFQDQQRADELLEQLQRGIDQINAMLAKQEMQRYMQEMMDQEVFAMFMLMASE